MAGRDSNDRSVLPRGRKARAVLAMLALAAPRPLLRRDLTALLWSTRMPAQARGSLRQAVHELQDMLALTGGPPLTATRETIALATDGLWVDVAQRDLQRVPRPEVSPLFLADLSGLDPAFDRWLHGERDRHAAGRPIVPPSPEPASPELASPELPARIVPRPDRPLRLGVMPPRDAEQGGLNPLSVGLAEEISSAMAKFRWIDCVDPVSLARMAETPRPGNLAWEALALDFLLEGSVLRSEGPDAPVLRLSVRLLDLREGGTLVWSGRFEHRAVDLFAIQDRLAGEIAAQLDPELMLREGARMAARRKVDASAYELVLRAIPAIHRLDRDSYLEAGRLLEKAVEAAPDYGAAHAWLAYWHLFLVGQGWVLDRRAAMRRAGELAERAVMLDRSDARALAILGHVRAFLNHRMDEAMALHERAIALNPNLPLALVFSGLSMAYLGRHEEALARILRYRDLSPLDPHAYLYEMALMVPMLMLGDYAGVVETGRRAMLLNPGFTSTHKVALSALGHLGRAAEAADMLARLLQLEPDFTVTAAEAHTPLRRAEDRALYAAGLRLAGVEE